MVQCDGDDCAAYSSADTEAEAIAAWNSRPVEDKLRRDNGALLEALKRCVDILEHFPGDEFNLDEHRDINNARAAIKQPSSRQRRLPMTTNCFYSQEVPEPLPTMVEREPLVMLNDEPEGYPLEACRGIVIALVGMAILALVCGLAWWRMR